MSQPCTIPLHSHPGPHPALPYHLLPWEWRVWDWVLCFWGQSKAAQQLTKGTEGTRGWHPRAAVCSSQRLPGHGRCCWVTVPMSGGIRQVLLVVSGCSKGGDGAVGEHGLGNDPGGVCCSGRGQVGDRALCSPGTRDFFQSHPECPWRGWLRLCVGLGQPQSPEPLAPSVTPK